MPEAIMVRTLQPGDVQQATRVFSEGMRTTITSGCRASRSFLALCAVVGAFAMGIASFWTHIGSLIAGCALPALIYTLLPPRVAQNYVNDCCMGDMRDPMQHYVHQDRSNFWVAISGDEVVGCVAVELPASCDASAPWDAASGEAELRRMSVAAGWQGRGISRMLFEELQQFCRQKGFRRIVLSTSSMQTTAVKLYPRLGFSVVKQACVPSVWFPLATVSYFSKDLS